MKRLGLALVITVVAVASVVTAALPARAVDVGEPAPAFKLAGTNGADIALNDFKGKNWVFLEFYALDFQPA